MEESDKFSVSASKLPKHFPTHAHDPEFWEALGRAVATFGFLEDTLGRAIFAFSGRREIAADDVEAEVARWHVTLERTVSGALAARIDTYGKFVRDHASVVPDGHEALMADLREAAVLRNVLCHGSWQKPDAQGKSIPRYATGAGEKLRAFQTPIDVAYLSQVQVAVAGMITRVVNSVTRMGWHFPGSDSPGARL